MPPSSFTTLRNFSYNHVVGSFRSLGIKSWLGYLNSKKSYENDMFAYNMPMRKNIGKLDNTYFEVKQKHTQAKIMRSGRLIGH